MKTPKRGRCGLAATLLAASLFGGLPGDTRSLLRAQPSGMTTGALLGSPPGGLTPSPALLGSPSGGLTPSPGLLGSPPGGLTLSPGPLGSSPSSLLTPLSQPLLVTTMTHMEGDWQDDLNRQLFSRHCEQLRLGIQLADAYGVKLTVESELPFARACTTWGVNMLREVLDAGHGVGTHSDVGFRTPALSVTDFGAVLKERKDLVDGLVGASNNRHTSGAGGVNDWVKGCQAAGFQFINGIVGMHCLAMPLANRPDPSWTDQWIRAQGYHEHAPPALIDRLYPITVSDAQDFVADPSGSFVVSNGELGKLSSLAEQAAGFSTQSGQLDRGDCLALFEAIEEADRIRDRRKVAKINLYLPASIFSAQNESILREAFAGLKRYADAGVIQLVTQGQAYDRYRTSQSMIQRPSHPSITGPTPGLYTLFTINTHDWVNAQDSIDTINRVLDIHEEKDIPVDIYLTDPMVQLYSSQAPRLMSRLRSSPVVCVSYHSRAPAPYYTNFDFLGFTQMSPQDRFDTLLEYQEHALDLRTGRTTCAPGGFTYLKQLLGYAPRIVGAATSSTNKADMLQIYRDKGALFAAVHGRDVDFGESQEGIWLRPEHVAVKLYEAHGTTGGAVIEDELAKDVSTSDVRVLNLKFHENNFYLHGTPWWPSFYTDSSKTTPLQPPFDLSASIGAVPRKSSARSQEVWRIYEEAVEYAAQDKARFRPINGFGLERLLQRQTP